MGEDNYDWSGVPNWLQFLLTMDNIHAWGMRGERSDRDRPTGEFLSRWYNMEDLHVAEIPQRELDDPPDSWGSSREGDGSAGLIEELSGPENEEIYRELT